MGAMRVWMATAALAVAAAAPAMAANHAYEFNGNLQDSLGGPALSAIGAGGSAYASGWYSFAQGGGLSVSDAVAPDVYTIDMRLSLSAVDGYRRLLDFKGGASDTGLYNLGGLLNFYNERTGTTAGFVADTPVRVTVTRDSLGSFTGYLNGVQQFSFDDSTLSLSTFSVNNQLARFFIDDNSVGGEHSAGAVDFIRIYDLSMSSSQVAALVAAPVPEPGSYAMLVMGGLLMGAVVQRRRRSQRQQG